MNRQLKKRNKIYFKWNTAIFQSGYLVKKESGAWARQLNSFVVGNSEKSTNSDNKMKWHEQNDGQYYVCGKKKSFDIWTVIHHFLFFIPSTHPGCLLRYYWLTLISNDVYMSFLRMEVAFYCIQGGNKGDEKTTTNRNEVEWNEDWRRMEPYLMEILAYVHVCIGSVWCVRRMFS